MKNLIILAIVGAIAVIGLSYMVYAEYFSDDNLEMHEIGLLFPTTGDFATNGNENFIAANMAINDFNEHLEKSDKDWRLKAINANTKSDPEISLKIVEKLYAKNIQIFIGPETSAELATIKPFVDANDILVISPSSTAPSLAVEDNIFRLAPDDRWQGLAVVGLLKESDIKTVLLLTRDDTWGNELSTTISNSFIEYIPQGSIIRMMYDPLDPNYSETTNNISFLISNLLKSYDADEIAIVLLGFGESTEFLKSANSFDNLDDVKWFGTDSNANEKRITSDSDALKFANKVNFTAVQFGSTSNLIRDDVETRIIEQTGSAPSTYAYSSYDAVWIIGLSILETENTDPNHLSVVIKTVASKYRGALGNTSLNDAGDLLVSNYDIWEIVDDKWQVTGYYAHHITDEVFR